MVYAVSNTGKEKSGSLLGVSRFFPFTLSETQPAQSGYSDLRQLNHRCKSEQPYVILGGLEQILFYLPFVPDSLLSILPHPEVPPLHLYSPSHNPPSALLLLSGVIISAGRC